ncbi:hypothetical protein, partial [Ferrimicrobium acidiphilum]|uniref:hypothetical protein n=2 Tax=Ferrimicrobium acidiphilum TaxID=121039 RepID=UPI0023F03097
TTKPKHPTMRAGLCVVRCSGLGNPLGYGDLKPESFNPLAQSLYLNSWIVVALEVIGTCFFRCTKDSTSITCICGVR